MNFWRGGGQYYDMMLLVLSTTMFIVDKDSIKYGLPTKIIPQEGYNGMKKIDSCYGPQPHCFGPIFYGIIFEFW